MNSFGYARICVISLLIFWIEEKHSAGVAGILGYRLRAIVLTDETN
ncbi:Hypothetical protein CpCap5W_0787 [Corynebacterium pseudotuberculosis]|nr:Hypothetical protein Cp3995_1912 [Corynebacterium pseudotuberculosis 3/99-5]ARS60283.1 Hypothetical protein CpATCC19410_0811 [Corynebacterium pseudotuberculosis]AZN19636.1 hypothetical protein CpCap1W_0783 [Corynebacterium pseudotuberculosis]AZN21736.1 Hypothetical protein CpOviAF1_0780 [Corynebacterium pseudotuberculosis]QBB90775.1 hypothetical protein CpCR07_0788 [Corynebacterium pseudotuberculosis]